MKAAAAVSSSSSNKRSGRNLTTTLFSSGRFYVGSVGLGERRNRRAARAGTVLRGEERQTEEYERMVAKREREERINGSSNSSDSNSEKGKLFFARVGKRDETRTTATRKVTTRFEKYGPVI